MPLRFGIEHHSHKRRWALQLFSCRVRSIEDASDDDQAISRRRPMRLIIHADVVRHVEVDEIQRVVFAACHRVETLFRIAMSLPTWSRCSKLGEQRIRVPHLRIEQHCNLPSTEANRFGWINEGHSVHLFQLGFDMSPTPSQLSQRTAFGPDGGSCAPRPRGRYP